MPDTEKSGRSSCSPVAYKRSIRKKRQIARERTLWETNDRDVLLAEAVGCRKLNAASKDNQEVEFGLAFAENQLIRGYLQFFGERPDRVDLLIGEQGNCFFRTKRIKRAIGIPHNQNIRPGCVRCHGVPPWGTWLKWVV
jgi:CRISPR/Cas system type I-B associated protein Csh2 (Cas7 group RAMP superfamily)